jgi:hypothetical protein
MKWRGAVEINKSFSHGPLLETRSEGRREERPTRSWGKERYREYKKQ